MIELGGSTFSSGSLGGTILSVSIATLAKTSPDQSISIIHVLVEAGSELSKVSYTVEVTLEYSLVAALTELPKTSDSVVTSQVHQLVDGMSTLPLQSAGVVAQQLHDLLTAQSTLALLSSGVEIGLAISTIRATCRLVAKSRGRVLLTSAERSYKLVSKGANLRVKLQSAARVHQ